MKAGEEHGPTFPPNNDEENEQSMLSEPYLLIPNGFQSRALYKPKSKSKEITGGKSEFIAGYPAKKYVQINIVC